MPTKKNRKELRACAALLALMTLAAGIASAQTSVYRCGPDGRQYSEKPCAGGRAVDVNDARSAAQREAADEVASREAALARDLAQDNRQRERAQRPGAAVSLNGEAQREPQAKAAAKPDKVAHKHRARKPKSRKPSPPADFTALAPGSEPPKKKRRRPA